MGERTCSVQGCERKFYGRGWCQLHYNRVRNTGTTEPRVFAPRVCKVDDCDENASKPGAARGWCGSHYQRWQRHGDPLGRHEPVVGVAPCSIGGCDEVVNARGWCVKHYTRWTRFGDPEARLRGEVVGGCRICPSCGEDKPTGQYSPGQAYCRPCMAAKTAEYRLTHPYEPVAGTPAECDCCGQAFLANKRRNRYCSKSCFVAFRHKANWKHNQARRARLAAAFVEHFDRLEIFERDNWTCQICRRQLSPETPWPDRAFASLDHVIPIARGGEHSRANAQTACLDCNVRKGVRLM